MKNVGKIDRVIRLVVGLVIIIAGIVAKSWLGLIGIVPLATAIFGYCPAYSPFKINTCGNKKVS